MFAGRLVTNIPTVVVTQWQSIRLPPGVLGFDSPQPHATLVQRQHTTLPWWRYRFESGMSFSATGRGGQVVRRPQLLDRGLGFGPIVQRSSTADSLSADAGSNPARFTLSWRGGS